MPNREKSVATESDQGLKELLKPILRFCLQRGVRLQAVLKVLKEGFVEVAREELSKQGAKESVSRVSVMTGIYRKEIQEILDGAEKPKPRISVLSRILGQWMNHRDYCDGPGEPRILDCLGKESEFTELVGSVNKEVNPYAILFELERLGLAENRDGKIRLLVSEMVPEKKVEEGLRLVADDVVDLLSIVERNMEAKSDVPELHLKTAYDDIAEENIPEIRYWLLKEGADFHRRARDYLSQFDRDLNPVLRAKKGGGRVSIGTFGTTVTSETDE